MVCVASLPHSLVLNDKFWTLVSALEALQGPIYLDELCKQSATDESEVARALAFLAEIGLPYEVKKQGERKKIHPPEGDRSIKIELNPLEWLALQAGCLLGGPYEHKAFQKTLSKKIKTIEKACPTLNIPCLRSQAKNSPMTSSSKENLQALERAIVGNEEAKLIFHNGDELQIRPRKVLYLNDMPSVVAEGPPSGHLKHYSLDKVERIAKAVKEDSCWKGPLWSSYEVTDYIDEVRSLDGKDHRLILKILAHSDVDLAPPYIYMSNPYITANSDGEMIWSATVEAGHELFSWLYQLREKVDIIDPDELSFAFEEWCRDQAGRDKKVG